MLGAGRDGVDSHLDREECPETRALEQRAWGGADQAGEGWDEGDLLPVFREFRAGRRPFCSCPACGSWLSQTMSPRSGTYSIAGVTTLQRREVGRRILPGGGSRS